MTKLLPLTLLCVLLSVSVLSAQHSSNNFSVSTGIGLTPSFHGKNVSSQLPALNLTAAYDIGKNFSLGAYVGYTQATTKTRIFSDGLASKVENKTTAFGLRAEFKREMTDKFELYGGIVAGYKMFNIKEMDAKTGAEVVRVPEEPTPYNPNPAKGEILYSGFVGGKYFLTDHIGLYGEIGYGLTILTAGTTFKF